MASFNFKKLLPHILIVVGFAVFTLIYFYPSLQGKTLSSGDNTQWQGMAHEAMEWHKKTGQNTLWTNSMFGGMPTYTHYMPEQNNLIGQVQNAITNIMAKPAYFLFIAMLCFYALMQVLRVNRWLGVAGAFAFAFSTFNLVLIAAGHDTELLAIAYVPAIIAGFILIYRGKYWGGAALMGAAFAMQATNAHYQVSYYTMIILGFAFVGMLIDAIRSKTPKQFALSTVVAVLTGVIAIGPSMAVMLPTKEYQKVTMRAGKSELTTAHDTNKKSGGLDKDYAFEWSNGIGETFVSLVPYLYGGSSGEPADVAPATSEALGPQYERVPLYWGPQDRGISGPVYFGAIICFLFVLGLMIIKSPHKWWMLAVCILAFMMSWGKNFAALNYFLFDHLPLLNNFRTPSMILVIPEIIFPIVAIWAVQTAIMEAGTEENRKTLWKNIKIAAGITAGVAFILGVAGPMFFDYTNHHTEAKYPEQILSALKEDRISMARMSGIKSAIYILLAAGLLWAYLTDKIKKVPLIAGLGLLFAIDLLPVAHRYVNEDLFHEKSADKEEAPFQPSQADLQILQDKDPYYRVLDLSSDPYNDARQAYFHKSIGGYHPAKMEIYQDLISTHLNGQSFNAQVLNMLNTKYIITPGGKENGPQVIPNPQALGNAWFVSNIKWVRTADEEMASMNAGKIGDTAAERPNAFNPKQTAIVRDNFKQGMENFVPSKDSAAYVKLAKYGLDEISFQSSNSKEGLAVFSDIWYPYGWKAYVDNKETPIIRANYVLRALRLPPGNHNIVFRFHPDTYYTGNTIALITSLILIVLVIVALYNVWKDGSKETEEQPIAKKI